MGYRKIKDCYLKLIGYSALKVQGDKFYIACVFKANDDFHVWKSSTYEENLTVEEYLSLIKQFETDNLYLGHEETLFEFITPEQLYLCN